MLKLARYLKPFAGMIIAAVALLFVQAMADLALPDYMSDIVNKGIQQGGIANAVPKAVRQKEMQKLVLFMTDEESGKVLENYAPVDRLSAEYGKYVKEYPGLAHEAIYVLNNTGKDTVEKLKPIMGRAFLAVSGIEKFMSSAGGKEISFNGMKIPAGSDIFELLEKLPAQQRSMTAESINKKFTALGDSMVNQAAVAAVKAEYEVLGVDTAGLQRDYIVGIGAVMLLVSLLGGSCAVAVGFLSAKTAAGLSRDLRRKVFTTVESFSNAEIDKFSTASLITRTTNDITQIQMLTVIILRMAVFAPIMGIGGIIRALGKSVSMSWIIALAVIILLGMILAIFSIAFPRFKKVQELIDRLNLVTRENLSGMMVIRAFNRQKFEEERFDRANKDLTSTSLFINRVMVVLMPFMMLLMNGVMLLIIWVGAHRIESSSMQVGDMMAFMQYAVQIIFSFMMVSIMFIMIPRASVSARRVMEVLETKASIVDPDKPEDFKEGLEGLVEFNNVSFRYPGATEDVLKNVSFKALPGQTTAIIGSTGAGKTTLVNLILRFYDVAGGEVLVDGTDVRKVKQGELRSRIGYVPQKASLFSGTIESNLRYAGEDATDDDIKKAAEIAQALDFIAEKPEGFKSEISQGGANVSGGQKQRLSIARALVKKPEIYIFDDSFSALDFRTDAALRKALGAVTGKSSVIIVTQRISTAMDADRIVVLDEGRVAGIGTHRELMKNCAAYREIALSQLSEEELA